MTGYVYLLTQYTIHLKQWSKNNPQGVYVYYSRIPNRRRAGNKRRAWKFGKNDKPRTLNKRRASEF